MEAPDVRRSGGELCVCPDLFVGGHDPLDGVGSRRQQVTGCGESLRPLAHHHLRLAVCSFWPRHKTGVKFSKES